MADMSMGQYLLADVLPSDVYRPGQIIDKGSAKQIFGDLARNHPDRYKELSNRAAVLGREVGTMTGGGSFSIRHLATPKGALARREQLKQQVATILQTLPESEHDKAITAALAKLQATDSGDTVAEIEAEGNPLSMILKGAGRGNPAAIARLVSSDLMYADAAGRPIPVPVVNSYSHGLTPAEYVASTFGVRSGLVTAKTGIGMGGYAAKLLLAAAHRMVVTGEDAPEALAALSADRGLPVDTDDKDNIGALLARDTGPYKRNTRLDPKILAQLKKLGHDQIVVRSPLTSVDPEGGVYAKDVGYREKDQLPGIGEAVGITAAGAVSEPVSQALLSAKHKGGLAEEQTDELTGFALIDRLINTPKEFREAATHTEVDGRVDSIYEAPQGGSYVRVADQEYYVPANRQINVKVGDTVEAGDQLTDGAINPRVVVQHKGLGEGGRQLVTSLRKAIGGNAHRRNVELIVRGLVDRVRVTQEFDDYTPDDVVPYNEIAARWQPRETSKVELTDRLTGKYLERPVLHYSVGTRITPSVRQMLQKHKIKQVTTNEEPPPFEPELVRATDLLRTDSDWMTRQIGTGLQKGLLESAHRGRVSDEESTSFVPARAHAVNFGRVGKVQLKPPLSPADLPDLGHL
jgi:hypothetical protein